ncbi:MAG: MFS transporter [Spirochaetia bacterium]
MKKESQLRKSYLFLIVSIATAGYLAAETAVVLPVFARIYGLSPSQLGNLISARFLGGIGAAVLLMVLGDKNTHSTYIRAVSAAGLAASLPIFFSGSYAALITVSLIRGVALTTTIANVNVGITGAFSRSTDRWSSRVHSFFGVGLISAPVISILVNSLALPWQIIWSVPVAAWILILFLDSGKHAAETRLNENAAGGGEVKKKSLILIPVILLFAAINVGIEAMIVGWSPTYLELTGAKFGPVGTIQVILSGMIIAGRRTASVAAGKVGVRRYFHISAALIFCGALLMMFLHSASWAVVLLLITFAWGMSALYPLMVARFSPAVKLLPGRFFPVLEIAATTGGTLFPFILGRFSDTRPLIAFPVCLIVGTVLLASVSTVFYFLKQRRL